MTSSPAEGQSPLSRIAGSVNASLETHFWRWASLLVLLFLIVSIAKDVRGKLWLDELFTLETAKQPGPSQIVKAIEDGSDGAPPLYAILVQALLPFVKPTELAVRLPSTLGFCAMLLCLLGFCRRRLPALYAFVTALLAGYLCLYYATEGRGYGIVLGSAAGALLCWQFAVEGRRRYLVIPLLALCLSLATAVHYYSIFLLGPFFLAEMVRLRISRKLDIALIAALLPTIFVLAGHYPLLVAARSFQEHYWSPAEWTKLEMLYDDDFFLPLRYFCPLLFVAILVVPKSSAGQGFPKATLTVPEWTLLGAIALMPVAVMAISKVSTHAFVGRYCLWASLAFTILAGVAVCNVFQRQAAVGLVLLALGLTLIPRQALSARRNGALRNSQTTLEELGKLPDGQEPIFVADKSIFLELVHYAPARLSGRLLYPLSRDLDLLFQHTDTHARLMAGLSRNSKIRIVDYQAALEAYPHFILAQTPDDYAAWYLLSKGYRVVPIEQDSGQPLLFRVDAP